MYRLSQCFLIVLVLAACSPKSDVTLTNDDTIRWQQTEGKTVVVNYFAEWCSPCLRELPELNEFYHEHAQADDNIQLVGVSFDPLTNAQIRELKAKHEIDYPLALAQPLPRFPFERPKMLPATYIFTADGQVKGPLMGEQTVDSLLKAVNE